jgi:hypothetical protein
MTGTRNDWPAATSESCAAGVSLPDAEALIAEARRRQRRRWHLRAILSACVAALATATAGAIGLSGQAGRGPAGADKQAPEAPAAAMPSQIVVWTGNFQVEVLSARTGRLVRTLATNVGLYQGLPTIAVSRDGIVYFDTAHNRRQWVMSVPITGGRPTTVSAGYSPAISPDGRQLAYVAWTDCVLPCVSSPEAIVVRDLITGQQHSWSFTSILPAITSMS